MGVVRLVRGACVPRGGHTKETNGYLSMRSRMFRISWSRLGAHTSRMGDIYPNCFNLMLLMLSVPEGEDVPAGGVTHINRARALSHT
jgi:hypothetical protein